MSREQQRWSKTKKQWIKDNPPSYGDYWYCIIGGRALTDDLERLDYGALPLTLDHDLPRSRAPGRRHDLDNLNPMCEYHNGDKGSKSLDQYLHSDYTKGCKF